MHEASWPRVQWQRLSWSRKDFLTACGGVLVRTISLGGASYLVSSCVVLSDLFSADSSGLVSAGLVSSGAVSSDLVSLGLAFLIPGFSGRVSSSPIVSCLLFSPLAVALRGLAFGLLWSLLQASWKPLGGVLGPSWGLLGGLWPPWAAPGPSRPLWRRAWPAPWSILARSWR